MPYEEMGRVAPRALTDRCEGGAGRRKGADGEHVVLGTHVVVENAEIAEGGNPDCLHPRVTARPARRPRP
ncbi:hypothetical protein ACGFZB_33750 [Streptomyces cinerochromogenes]|uniref:Uncharacterized protein n=1 Tax=Streptomyces cinerochromogenes TaxID=66422 RepID=A0ABW7BDP0_9ACTN